MHLWVHVCVLLDNVCTKRDGSNSTDNLLARSSSPEPKIYIVKHNYVTDDPVSCPLKEGSG